MATATAPLATQLEELSSDEILRYSRHLILPEVALEGSSGSRRRACCSSVRAGSARRSRCI
jgi:hypothetical protein